MGKALHVNEKEFDTQVLQAEQPVLVDFWAEWCGPCRMIAPIVEDIAGEFSGRVKVVKMDTDANPRTPQSLGIMSIPTVIVFKGGRPVERTVGYRPTMKGDLKAKLTA